MSLQPIDSLADPRLDPYRALKQLHAPARRERLIAEGRWLVQRLLASSYQTESVVVERRRLDDVGSHCPPQTPIYVLPDGAAAELVGFNFHRGVLACGIRPRPTPVTALPASLAPGAAVLIGLAGVQDPENLGGVLRNAAAFGATAVVLGPGCADPFSRRVLRVSMGTVLRLSLFWSRDLPADIAGLRSQAGFSVLATVLDQTALPLSGYTPAPRVLLLLGEEAYGLPDAVLRNCDQRLIIPMADGVDSLNVATASGVFLYHLTNPAIS